MADRVKCLEEFCTTAHEKAQSAERQVTTLERRCEEKHPSKAEFTKATERLEDLARRHEARGDKWLAGVLQFFVKEAELTKRLASVETQAQGMVERKGQELTDHLSEVRGMASSLSQEMEEVKAAQ